MNTAARTAPVVPDEVHVEEPLDIDFDATLAALDALEARETQTQEEQLRAVGAPLWAWEDLHVCVSNNDGVCERCLHFKAGV